MPLCIATLHKIPFKPLAAFPNINIVKTMDNQEKEINPVTITMISPQKEYRQSRGSNQQPPVLKFYMLLTAMGVGRV